MMSARKLSSREKIVRSALALFSHQGITATTTKEIAEQAGVNEVTLFRQFGSKQGLLLAVLQESSMLGKMQAALTDIVGANNPLLAYGEVGLDLLGNVPELVRSLIGESGQFPPENLQALGQALRQANQQTTGYLRSAQLSELPAGVSVDEGASLLNTLLLGYAVMDFSSDGHGFWPNQAAFLASVEALFSSEGQAGDGLADDISTVEPAVSRVADLPEETVRSLFQKAKKQGVQAYALAYVLFGAGLRAEEAMGLMRSQSFSTKSQHLLTVTGPSPRQVPLNRWIMGNRYGTYAKNPLTQWLKSRQDEQPEVFVDEAGEPLGVAGITQLWDAIAADIPTTTGAPATLSQARATWCIELLMKGMSLENLSILSGLSLSALEAYSCRAREKTALEQALAIDQKTA
ncbi:MAG: helix-turn-helix domain-containing protein [Cyanobacteria bacterium J06634_5]